MRMRNLVLGLLTGLLVTGCGRTPVALVPVAGVVRYRNFPLHTGCVVFVPMEEKGFSGPLAWAEIRADGSFSLRTKDEDGAPAGWYLVTISAVDMPPSPAGGYPLPRLLIPSRYADPRISGLTCEVHSQKENRLELNLD